MRDFKNINFSKFVKEETENNSEKKLFNTLDLLSSTIDNNIVNICKLFNCPDKSNLIDKINSLSINTASACAKLLITGSSAWSCLDCQADSNCIICCDCYEKGKDKHKNHNVIFKQYVSGCCDCGDPDSWSPEGNCPDHLGILTDKNDIIELIKKTFSNVDKCFFEKNIDRSEEKNNAYNNFSTLEWLIIYICNIINSLDKYFALLGFYELNKDILNIYIIDINQITKNIITEIIKGIEFLNNLSNNNQAILHIIVELYSYMYCNKLVILEDLIDLNKYNINDNYKQKIKEMFSKINSKEILISYHVCKTNPYADNIDSINNIFNIYKSSKFKTNSNNNIIDLTLQELKKLNENNNVFNIIKCSNNKNNSDNNITNINKNKDNIDINNSKNFLSINDINNTTNININNYDLDELHTEKIILSNLNKKYSKENTEYSNCKCTFNQNLLKNWNKDLDNKFEIDKNFMYMLNSKRFKFYFGISYLIEYCEIQNNSSKSVISYSVQILTLEDMSEFFFNNHNNCLYDFFDLFFQNIGSYFVKNNKNFLNNVLISSSINTAWFKLMHLFNDLYYLSKPKSVKLITNNYRILYPIIDVMYLFQYIETYEEKSSFEREGFREILIDFETNLLNVFLNIMSHIDLSVENIVYDIINYIIGCIFIKHEIELQNTDKSNNEIINLITNKLKEYRKYFTIKNTNVFELKSKVLFEDNVDKEYSFAIPLHRALSIVLTRYCLYLCKKNNEEIDFVISDLFNKFIANFQLHIIQDTSLNKLFGNKNCLYKKLLNPVFKAVGFINSISSKEWIYYGENMLYNYIYYYEKSPKIIQCCDFSLIKLLTFSNYKSITHNNKELNYNIINQKCYTSLLVDINHKEDVSIYNNSSLIYLLKLMQSSHKYSEYLDNLIVLKNNNCNLEKKGKETLCRNIETIMHIMYNDYYLYDIAFESSSNFKNHNIKDNLFNDLIYKSIVSDAKFLENFIQHSVIHVLGASNTVVSFRDIENNLPRWIKDYVLTVKESSNKLNNLNDNNNNNNFLLEKIVNKVGKKVKMSSNKINKKAISGYILDHEYFKYLESSFYIDIYQKSMFDKNFINIYDSNPDKKLNIYNTVQNNFLFFSNSNKNYFNYLISDNKDTTFKCLLYITNNYVNILLENKEYNISLINLFVKLLIIIIINLSENSVNLLLDSKMNINDCVNSLKNYITSCTQNIDNFTKNNIEQLIILINSKIFKESKDENYNNNNNNDITIDSNVKNTEISKTRKVADRYKKKLSKFKTFNLKEENLKDIKNNNLSDNIQNLDFDYKDQLNNSCNLNNQKKDDICAICLDNQNQNQEKVKLAYVINNSLLFVSTNKLTKNCFFAGCHHVVHLKCWSENCVKLIHKTRIKSFDYYCPLCRSIVNIILPITDNNYLDNFFKDIQLSDLYNIYDKTNDFNSNENSDQEDNSFNYILNITNSSFSSIDNRQLSLFVYSQVFENIITNKCLENLSSLSIKNKIGNIYDKKQSLKCFVFNNCYTKSRQNVYKLLNYFYSINDTLTNFCKLSIDKILIDKYTSNLLGFKECFRVLIINNKISSNIFFDILIYTIEKELITNNKNKVFIVNDLAITTKNLCTSILISYIFLNDLTFLYNVRYLLLLFSFSYILSYSIENIKNELMVMQNSNKFIDLYCIIRYIENNKSSFVDYLRITICNRLNFLFDILSKNCNIKLNVLSEYIEYINSNSVYEIILQSFKSNFYFVKCEITYTDIDYINLINKRANLYIEKLLLNITGNDNNITNNNNYFLVNLSLIDFKYINFIDKLNIFKNNTSDVNNIFLSTKTTDNLESNKTLTNNFLSDFSFIQLPNSIISLYEKYNNILCNLCNTIPKYAVLCLICNKKLCFSKLCCNTLGRKKNLYEIEYHSIVCANGYCAFVSIFNGNIIYTIDSKLVASDYYIYLNKYDEIIVKDKEIGKNYNLRYDIYKSVFEEYITFKSLKFSNQIRLVETEDILLEDDVFNDSDNL